MRRRLTQPLPNNSGYRIVLLSTGEGIRTEICGATISVWGEFANILGKLEDAAPIEHWLEEAEKIKRNRY